MANLHKTSRLLSPTSLERNLAKAATKNGRSAADAAGGVSPLCPQCGSQKTWKDGLRYSLTGDSIQRWLCRNCGNRFSQPGVKFDVSGQVVKALRPGLDRFKKRILGADRPGKKSANSFSFGFGKDVRSHKVTAAEKVLNTFGSYTSNRQICVKETKNLATVEKQAIEPRRSEQEIKGKILEHGFWMQKQAYAADTVRGHISCLRTLLNENANLLDPESIKEVLAKDLAKKTPKWGQDRRRNIITACSLFLKRNGVQWEKPKCKTTRKFPFIPIETELDALIAASGKKNATFSQVLKETAMRPGEAKRLQWINIDPERNVITLNEPEKGSNPRMWKVTSNLICMLNALPKTDEQIFLGSLKSMKTTWIKNRKRLAQNLQNPRLHKITFYTFRHWKATMLYHETKDIVYVQQFLGHKDIRNTMIYINIEHTLFETGANDEFTVKVATTAEEIKALLEIGFEYILQKDDKAFLRKRR
jgi:integrase